MTRFFIADIAPLTDEALFRVFFARMPGARQEKIARLRQKPDQLRSLAVGALLRHACEEAGIPGADGFLTFNEYQKPGFAWETGLFFNLSHSGNYALCGISEYAIGCDAERVRPYNERVARRAFSESENRWLLAQQDRDFAFTRLWTRRESLLKMLGTGLSGLGTVSAPPHTRFEARADSHVFAVCVQAENLPDVPFETVDLRLIRPRD